MKLFLCSVALATAIVSQERASAQCLEWSNAFGAPGTDGPISATSVFDDGSGPALFATGSFLTAGSSVVTNFARWDGAQWTGVPGGVDGGASSLIAGDDGNGPALFVGGDFHGVNGMYAPNVARWDGNTWTTFPDGFNGAVVALALFDDGLGTSLYAGGSFTVSSSTPVHGLGRWRNGQWQDVGGGSPVGTRSLLVFDDGSGPALYSGGAAWLGGVARWNGSAWSIVGSGFDATGTFTNYVYALASIDTGSGNELWAAGRFDIGGVQSNVARLVAGVWTSVGGGTNGRVNALAAFDDGAGARVHAGGTFTLAGGTPASNIARWDGTSWSAVGPGANGAVNALSVFDLEGTPALFASGAFVRNGALSAYRSAAWNGSAWSALGDGQGMAHSAVLNYPARVYSLESFDDGKGSALYAGGQFELAGPARANNIARWDGSGWSALGGGLTNGSSITGVNALQQQEDLAGSSLYATGSFAFADEVSTRAIARWDGSQWNDMAGGLEPVSALSTSGYALTRFDDGTGTKLIVGGRFTGAAAIVSKNIIAWDGQQWSALPSLLDVAGNETLYVNALAVFDDGAGPKLYAAAEPTGTPYPFVARLDGASWTVVGILEGYGIRTMHVHDDGIRPALYVGGYFFDNSFKHIVRWNGAVWTGIGSTLEHDINTMTSFDDGTGGGPSLYGMSGTQLVRWNGVSWSEIDGKLSNAAQALHVADDGHGPSLFVGGEFTAVGTQQASWGIARLDRVESEDCPSSTGTLYCSGDGSATPCPCGNVGATNHGCANSWEAAGGLLEAHGQAHVSSDRVTLVASDLPPTTSALLFQGTLAVNGGAGAVYGDGLRCAGGSAIRLETHAASGGVAVFGWDAFDAPISQTGLVPQSGATRFYQVWYRDNQSFCSSDVFNFTNGARITWVP